MKPKLTRSILPKNSWRFGLTLIACGVLVFFALAPSAAQLRNPKRITAIRLGTASEGSRVSIISDSALNDYEAFRRGDRFYVRLPAAEYFSSQPLFRGAGFQDVQVQKIGDSVVLSFWLQPGASAHVEQRANKLDVVFAITGMGAARPVPVSSNSGASRSRWIGSQGDTRGPIPSVSPNNRTPQTRTTDSGVSSYRRSGRSSDTSQVVGPKTTVAPDRKVVNQTDSGQRSDDQKPIEGTASPLPTPASPVASETPASTSTAGTSNAGLQSNSTVQPPAPQPTIAATSRSQAWAARKQYLMQWIRLNPILSVIAAIILFALIVILMALLLRRIKRSRVTKVITREAYKPKDLSRPKAQVDRARARPIAVSPQATAQTPDATVTPVSTPALEVPLPVSSSASVAPDVSRAPETLVSPVVKSVKHSSEATDLIPEHPILHSQEQTDSELKKLLVGDTYDPAVIGSRNSVTRQIVGAALLAAIASRNSQQHAPAREAYMSHGYFDEATRDLRTADSPAERAAAARKLGLVASAQGTSHLTAALYDSAPEVRRASVESLGQIGDPAAIAPLNELLKREDSRQLPEAVIRHAINSIAVTDAKQSILVEKPLLRIVEKPKTEPESEERESFIEFVDALKMRESEPPVVADSTSSASPLTVAQNLAVEEERLRREEEALRRAADELEVRKREAEAARLIAEQQARAKAENEARLRTEIEARIRAEEEARIRLEEEARRKAEAEAIIKAEEEARKRAEEEAIRRAAEDVRRRAEEEAARRKAEEEARIRAEQEERDRVEQEVRLRAEEEARFQLEAQTLRRAAEQLARKRAEAEAARKLVEEEARRHAEEEMRRKVEEEMRRRAEEEARQRAEAEVRRKMEEEARRKAEEEARRRIEEEARVKAEVEAQARRLAEEARKKAEEEAERRAIAEAQRLLEEEQTRKAEEAAARKFVEEARIKEETARLLREEQVKREAEERRAREEQQLRLEQEALLQAAQQLARRRSEIEESRKKAEEEARLLEETRDRVKAEEEAARRQVAAERERLQAESEQRLNEERQRLEEARRKSEEQQRSLQEEARLLAEEDQRRLLELEMVRKQAEEEGRRRAEQEQRIRAEIESLRRAEEEQRRRIETETQRRAEMEARVREEQAKREAEEEARQKLEEQAKQLAEEARVRAEEEARRREALLKQQEELRQAEDAARLKFEEETSRLAEETRQRAEQESRLRAEAEARLREQEELRQAEEAARLKIEEETRRLAEESRRRTEEESRLRAEAEARLRAEEARLRAEEEARLKAEAETQRLAEEVRLRADDDSRRRVEAEQGLLEEPARQEATQSASVDEEGVFELFEESRVIETVDIGSSPSGAAGSEVDLEEAVTAASSWVDLSTERNKQLPDSDETEIKIDSEPAGSVAADQSKQIDVLHTEKGIVPVGDDDGIPAELIRKLNSEQAEDRVAALNDLALLGGDDAFHQINKAFDDQSADVRNAAARSLFNLHSDRAASFTRALREATPERRRRIGASLASSGLAGDAIANLTGESREKTYDAFSLLFLMAKAGEVQPLMKAIEDYPNIEVRLAVVKLLALSGQPEIVPAFRRLAVRGSLPSEVRSAVMEAIYQISTQSRETTSSAA